MNFRRRDFLQYSIAGVASAPMATSVSGAASDFESVGEELFPQLGGIVQNLASAADNPRQPLLDSANEIGERYEPAAEVLTAKRVHQLEGVSVASQPVGEVFMKILTVCRDYFGFTIDRARYARYLFDLTSIGGILTSVAAIGEAAYKLYDANTVRGISRSNLNGELFLDYVSAVLGLAIELVLIWAPFSYKPAWRGTRFIANRTLLRLRRFSTSRIADAGIAIAMSLIHWVQRELIESGLSSLPDSISLIDNVRTLVTERADEIKFDCTINIDTGALPADVPLLQVDTEALREGMQTLLENGGVALEQLFALFGNELTELGFERNGSN
jgi:hypothetical protein